MTPEEYLKNGEWWYDSEGQFIWRKNSEGLSEVLLEIRGWAYLKKFYRGDVIQAAELQDKIGEFIIEAIKEKLNEKD